MAKQFLIIHGLGGSSDAHWQSWLADELLALGEKVAFPDLPNSSEPKLDEWLSALKKLTDTFDPNDKLIVLAHSLGPVCWTHFEKKYPSVMAERVYFVAPVTVYPDYEPVKNFFPLPDFNPHAQTTYTVIASNNDPWISFENTKDFVNKYRLEFVLLEGKGHINIDSGFGPWPELLSTCMK